MSGEEAVYQTCNKEKCEGQQRGAPSAELAWLFPFIRDAWLSARVPAFWEQAGLGKWQKEDSHVGEIVDTTPTGLGIGKISINTIATDNTNIDNNNSNSEHLCKAYCLLGTVLNI